MKKSLLSLFMVIAITSFTSWAYAFPNKKTLIISDIDDTIKASHILSKLSSASRAGNITVAFRGMAELYQLLVEEDPANTKVVYLSNAPQVVAGVPALQYAHQTFLSYNGFPSGMLLLRESLADQNHKIKAIRRLLTLEKPDVVIMIGDNGERDPEIYRQATSEFANTNIKMISFIHQVYTTKKRGLLDRILGVDLLSEIGKKLEPGQIGYVTPVEISLELLNQGLLHPDRVRKMIDQVAPEIVSERDTDLDTLGEVTFPSFKTCDRFDWHWQKTLSLIPLINKINSQCR